MCELCGGEARPTTLAIRRKLNTGMNFDLPTNVDLGKKLLDESGLPILTANSMADAAKLAVDAIKEA